MILSNFPKCFLSYNEQSDTFIFDISSEQFDASFLAYNNVLEQLRKDELVEGSNAHVPQTLPLYRLTSDIC